jgi:dimethylhistidine N-methyltransferase
LEPPTTIETFAAAVARDLRLTPKQLQSRYLYDALGISLFDAICRLPWYRITRAESRLLKAHAQAIASVLETGRPPSIVELGVGTGEKLALIVSAVRPPRAMHVHLIDISADALESTAVRLTEMRHVSVWKHEGTYEQGLERVARGAGAGGGTLVLFLGSNIGNFDPDASRALLVAIRQRLRAGDSLLLGADLVKPEADLRLAYDDPLGVTAAFNKNLLVRMNRELGADFALEAFEHRAIWNGREQRVEMHLVSRGDQAVTIRDLDLGLTFRAGESIWTESSYKYTERQIAEMGEAARFAARQQWIDHDARFALTLFEATSQAAPRQP